MKDDLMLDLERKIEKTIYKATLALDENNWSGWFELCDETFTYAITSFSPEINKNMTYFSGDKKRTRRFDGHAAKAQHRSFTVT